MKVISYSRVSTDIQDYERQINQIRQKCQQEKWTILKEFAEKESGTKIKREILTEMLEFIKNNTIDYLVVSELSRLGRTSKVLEILDYLNDNKIGLISLKENISTLNIDKTINHSSSLILSILTSINQFELDTIKFRSKSGIQNSILNGNAGGSLNLAYGYKKVNKKLVIDEEESLIIKEIFNLCLEGNGTTLIAKTLNNKNIETRTSKTLSQGLNKKEYSYKLKWVDGTIYSILKNTIYKGYRRYKGKELEYNENLQIVDNVTFDKAQQILKSNYSKSGKHLKFNYLLENKKIECGICHRNYFPHKRTSLKDNRYICLSKRYNENCSNYGISIDKIESLVNSVIFYHLDYILECNLDDKKINNQIIDYQTEIENHNKELQNELRKENKLIELSIENEIDNEIFTTKLKNIKNKQKSLKTKIKLLNENLHNTKIIYDSFSNIDNLKDKFNQNGIKLDKSIVNTIISKIIITKIDIENQNLYKHIKHLQYYNYFTNKQDKFLHIEFISGQTELQFIISQRELYTYDIQNNRIYSGLNKMTFNKLTIHLPAPEK